LFLYIFEWLLLFLGVMYRMSETPVNNYSAKTPSRSTKTPSKSKSAKNSVSPPPKTIFVGHSGIEYSDTDESDNELSTVVTNNTHDKPKNNNVIHSEMSAMKVYDDNGIPRPTGTYPGGKRKTRRPRKSRRQTKRRRQIKKK
jgi:hypothetical protein